MRTVLHPPHVVEPQPVVAAGHAGLVLVGTAEDPVLAEVGIEAPQPVTDLHEVLPDVGAGVVTTPGRRPGCEAVVVQTAGKYPTPVV